MREIGLLAQQELREAARSRWLPAFGFGLAFVVWLAASAQATGPAFGGGFNRTTAGLLNVVLVVVPAFGMMLGALRWAGERERGALALVLAQPVGRTELLLATVLGCWLGVGLAIAFGLGLGGALLVLFVPLGSVGEYVLFLLVAGALAGTSVSLGVLFGVLGGGRLRALGIALLAWLLFTVAYDLFFVALFLAAEPSGRLFVLAGLGNPVEAARVLTVLVVQPDLEVLGPIGAYLRDRMGVGAAAALLSSALALWVILPLAVASALFRQQDV